jgi:hypothetical protein
MNRAATDAMSQGAGVREPMLPVCVWLRRASRHAGYGQILLDDHCKLRLALRA